ncbi:MAG TPA: 3-deoxy-D-manno-octulosonic acid transferase [Pyrinomonadaceae bacterium]|nr:3-deoxy-D-manno-octulosonic acid transferase [Pyrinomonadaceae bacterium]
MYFLYSVLLFLGLLLFLPFALFRFRKYSNTLGEKIWLDLPDFSPKGKTIWIHCVSVGELNAATPLIKKVRMEFPERQIAVSTTTVTGRSLAEKNLAAIADAIFYFPFDFAFSVRRALRQLKPELIILIETEIWPRFIKEAKSSGSLICIANGRLSAKSFKRYKTIGFLIRAVLKNVDLIIAQSESDAKRFARFASADKILTAANLKFDTGDGRPDFESNTPAKTIGQLSKRFSLDASPNLIIAASTHPGEDEIIIAAFEKIREVIKTRLLIAPRHPERAGDIASRLANKKFSFAVRSEEAAESDSNAEVILLDSIGELKDIFRWGKICFIGGSLIKHGGQNPLEPAARALAIICGPHMENFDSITELLLQNHGIIKLAYDAGSAGQAADELAEKILLLSRDEERAEQMGKAAAEVVERNRGGVDYTINQIKSLLQKRK